MGRGSSIPLLAVLAPVRQTLRHSLSKPGPVQVLALGAATLQTIPGAEAAAGGAAFWTDECDTLGGSSGSPVLDRATGRVVGLHHFGFREGLDEPVNQAVEVARILEDLSTQVDPAVFDEVRQAPPP